MKKSLIQKNISIIYENINLPRVEALNYAISKANSDYLMRFDTRTRFANNYAEEALKLLNKKTYQIILLEELEGDKPLTLPMSLRMRK